MRLNIKSSNLKHQEKKDRTSVWCRKFAFLPHRVSDTEMIWLEWGMRHRDWVSRKGKYVWRSL